MGGDTRSIVQQSREAMPPLLCARFLLCVCREGTPVVSTQTNRRKEGRGSLTERSMHCAIDRVCVCVCG